jgi:hypothetical protein
MGLLGESCGAGLDFSSQDNIDYERLCVVMVLAVVTSDERECSWGWVLGWGWVLSGACVFFLFFCLLIPEPSKN